MVPSDFCRGGLLPTWSVICLQSAGNMYIPKLHGKPGSLSSGGFWISGVLSRVPEAAWWGLKADAGCWPSVLPHLLLTSVEVGDQVFSKPSHISTWRIWRLVASVLQKNPLPAVRVLSGFQPEGCRPLQWRLAWRRYATKKSKGSDASWQLVYKGLKL